jgi:hypothetical protein
MGISVNNDTRQPGLETQFVQKLPQIDHTIMDQAKRAINDSCFSEAGKLVSQFNAEERASLVAELFQHIALANKKNPKEIYKEITLFRNQIS